MIRERVFFLPEILYSQQSAKQVVSRSADTLIHNLCVKAELPLTTQDYNRLSLKYIRLYVYIYNLTQITIWEEIRERKENGKVCHELTPPPLFIGFFMEVTVHNEQ